MSGPEEPPHERRGVDRRHGLGVGAATVLVLVALVLTRPAVLGLSGLLADHPGRLAVVLATPSWLAVLLATALTARGDWRRPPPLLLGALTTALGVAAALDSASVRGRTTESRRRGTVVDEVLVLHGEEVARACAWGLRALPVLAVTTLLCLVAEEGLRRRYAGAPRLLVALPPVAAALVLGVGLVLL